MRSHLSNDEIEQLFFSSGEPASSAGLAEARAHLEGCASCRELTRRHQEAAAQIEQLRAPVASRPSKNCPPASVWAELAAGGCKAGDAEEWMLHASQCGKCGPLLKDACSDEAPALSAEEESVLRGLKTSNPEWQADFARHLAATGRPQPVRGRLLRFPRLAWVAGLAAALAVAAWFGVQQWRGSQLPALVARSYTEQRTIEMRIAGASYAPVREQRGSLIDSTPSLLDVLSRTKRLLETNPDNADALQARGRALLLAGQPDEALLLLEHTSQLRPGDLAVTLDLASAYYQRGASDAGRQVDIATSVELLGKVIGARPADAVARYNRAIALERLGCYQEALADWDRFLELQGSSDWAPEAQSRRKALLERIQERKQRSESGLRSLEQLSALESRDRAALAAELGERSERYLHEASETWLEQAFGLPSAAGPRAVIALSALASLIGVRHRDPWLAELLAHTHTVKEREGLLHLGRAIRLNRTTAIEEARREALAALTRFRETGNTAGAVRARFELTYGEQMVQDTEACARDANDALVGHKLDRYPWLMTQTLAEASICANLGATRPAILEQALHIAEAAHYDELALRCRTQVADALWNSGDITNAWRAAADAVRYFWTVDVPTQRGLYALAEMGYLADQQGRRYLQAEIWHEALPLSRNDPDAAVRGYALTQLGLAQLHTGQEAAGLDNLRRGEAEIRSKEGARAENTASEAEIPAARAELEAGHTGQALARLRVLEPALAKIHNPDLRLEFLQAMGAAELASGDRAPAEKALAEAFSLAEAGLPNAASEPGRLDWSRSHRPTYNSIARLLLDQPDRAFAYWEWYRGASLRSRLQAAPSDKLGSLPQLPTPHIAVADDTLVLSYQLLEDRPVLYVYDGKQVWLYPLGEDSASISAASQRFAELCADPRSPLPILETRARDLYRSLLAMAEPQLQGRARVIIEPDGPLAAVPFAALLTSDGRYFGERYAVTISPGLQYRDAARAWQGISPESRAVVVGDPAAAGFLPLVDAAAEAGSVARLFRSRRLLTGANATSRQVLLGMPNAEVFHFSGHAVASGVAAGPVLVGAEVLDSRQIESRAIHRLQIVVLSACSSAQGTTGLFLDRDSVARRFLAGGVPAVIASGWAVDSASTRILMADLYDGLLHEHLPPAEALRAAAARLRAQPGYAHPYYWAGFEVYGQT